MPNDPASPRPVILPAPGGLAARLRGYAPAPGRRPAPARGEKLRILHLLSQQPAKTGSGVYLLAMTEHAGRAGHEQRAVVGIPGDAPLPPVPPLPPEHVAAVRFDRAPVRFRIPGMSDVMPYPSTRFSTFDTDMLEGYLEAFAQALAEATQGFIPDVIHANHLWLAAALARLTFPRAALCVSSHNTELRQLANAPQLAPFVRPACADADLVFALHADNRDRIVEAYGIPEERILVTGAGFRDDVFRPAAPCPGKACAERELVIVYAGKITAAKGVPWLIEAMRKVRAPGGARVTLRLAGAAGSSEAESIREQAADLPHVTFLGPLPQEELAEEFRKADVFVLPSFFEGLPLVVVESMACGCRVVMTDLPGVDAWMPEGLCAEGHVERVGLPRLVGADTPVQDDLPGFVDELAGALTRQLERAMGGSGGEDLSCRLAPLSWAGVYAAVEAGYRRALAAG